MKKVCMITTVHNYDDVRIYHKEAKCLAMQGYEVTIINPNYSGFDEYNIKFYKINVPLNRKSRLIKAWKIALTSAVFIDADVYHLHDPELLLTGLKLRKLGKKVIYDSHEDTPRQIMNKEWISEGSRKFISKTYEKFENYCVRKFNVVIAATQTIADRFSNSVVIHNYPSEEEFQQNIEVIPYLKRKNNICYIGSISNTRGVIQTIDAITELNVNFILAGTYETLELKNEIEKMEAFKKVDYKGYLKRQEIVEVLNQSRVGILTLQPTISYKFSLPIKLFEYMLAGIPVVASNFEFWKELIGNAPVIYVDPTNHVEIRNAIEFLIKNPDRAKSMGEAGREMVLKKFTFEAEGKKLLKCYEKLFIE